MAYLSDVLSVLPPKTLTRQQSMSPKYKATVSG